MYVRTSNVRVLFHNKKLIFKDKSTASFDTFLMVSLSIHGKMNVLSQTFVWY
jgi:hypothetical protein